jgi:hypothetical protein
MLPVAEEHKKMLIVEPSVPPTRSPAPSGTAMSSAPRAIHCRTRFRTQSRSADFTARAQRFFEALKDKPSRKIVWIISAGGGDPLGKLGDLETGLYGIELSIGGNILVALAAYKRFPGLEGATSNTKGHDG